MNESIHTDCVIIGGGLAGLLMAAACADAGIRTHIIEAKPLETTLAKNFDGRGSAIALGSKHYLDQLGLWDAMATEAGPINDIRIVDDNSPLFLHYDARDVSDEPMGYIVENRYIRHALTQHALQHDLITLHAPASYTDITTDLHHTTATLDDGTQISAKLLIAADGKFSAIRQRLNIPTITKSYNQTAIVCTVKHEQNHHGTAVEKFLPAGPFAMLPMGYEGGGHYSSLVWTEASDRAPHYLAMDDDEFNQHMAARFGDWLGDVTLVGERWSYPLSLVFATHYTAERTCLIGDAAHGIHPIAGQGFNLGIRDIQTLASCLKETKNTGLDIGKSATLRRYEQLRSGDNLAMIAATDSLNALFSNRHSPLALARRIGLAIVNQSPKLQQSFMKHAMGIRS